MKILIKFLILQLLLLLIKINTYKNYIEKDEKVDPLNIGNNKLLEVSEIDGAAFVVNKSKFKSNIMDEKILYFFENIDMCFNTLKREKKLCNFECKI